MATINTAEYFRLPRIGALAPGYQADIAVFDSMRAIRPRMVMRRGAVVAKDGKFVARKVRIAARLRGSVNVRWLDAKDFAVRAEGKRIKVIEVVPHQIVTRKKIMRAKVEKGLAVSDTANDALKMVVVERHQASGAIGKGFVKGFGLKRGAIAQSVAHDSHNIIAVGADDRSIYSACVDIVKMGGGLSVADGDNILARMPLPIAGLMTDEPLESVVTSLEELLAAARKLGCGLPDPFMTLSFMALPVIPELKLTDKGLVDVNKMKITELFE